MGTVTNISGEDLEVTCLRRTVLHGETVDDVCDDLLDPAVQSWAPSHWLVNGEPQQAGEPDEPDEPEAEPDEPLTAPTATDVTE